MFYFKYTNTKHSTVFNCLPNQMVEQSLSDYILMVGVLNLFKPDWATKTTWMLFLISFF